MSHSNDTIQTEPKQQSSKEASIKHLLRYSCCYSFRDQTEIEVQKSNFRLTELWSLNFGNVHLKITQTLQKYSENKLSAHRLETSNPNSARPWAIQMKHSKQNKDHRAAIKPLLSLY